MLCRWQTLARLPSGRNLFLEAIFLLSPPHECRVCPAGDDVMLVFRSRLCVSHMGTISRSRLCERKRSIAIHTIIRQLKSKCLEIYLHWRWRFFFSVFCLWLFSPFRLFFLFVVLRMFARLFFSVLRTFVGKHTQRTQTHILARQIAAIISTGWDLRSI